MGSLNLISLSNSAASMMTIGRFYRKVKRFLKSTSGNIVVSTAIAMPCLLSGFGVAADYSSLYRYQSDLQQSVDSAALAVAKEMALASADRAVLKSVAKDYVLANTNEKGEKIEVDAVPDPENGTVEVTASKYWEPMFIQHIMKSAFPIVATAKAKLRGTGKICLVGLNTTKNKTVRMEKKARLVGDGCGVYSNSVHSGSIEVGDSSEVDASFICSSGGIKGYEKASFTPTPVVDCPPVGDPLSNRKKPTYSGCSKKKLEINGGNVVLEPGVYCDGLKIKGGATVTMKSGIYVITKKNFELNDGSTLVGEGVGILLDGKDATINFKKKTSIKLTAMEKGEMAGILFWGISDKYDSKKRHKFSSDDARILLGTIYLPNGKLFIDSEGSVADQSAYTAIIANQVELKYGPTLVLNSNYEDTSVPVPSTLKGGNPYLVK